MSSSIICKKIPASIEVAEVLVPSVDPHKVLQKLDLRLLPSVWIINVLCLLDRMNLGNTKISGLATDLRLTGVQFNLCIASGIITYSLLEVPLNIAMKRIGPSRWFPIIMFLWGSILISMAFVKNFGGLMTTRIFLGTVESGVLPGLTYYLCMWYPKSAQAKRIAVMYSGVALSGAFGGLLAYAIEKMNGIGGLFGWSWMFLLEGLYRLVTVIVAIILFFCLPGYPENATFLTDTERTWLLDTIKCENAGSSKQFKRKFIIQALRDPQAYMFTLMFSLGSIASISFNIFLPIIINGLGYSPAHAQLLSIPPHVAASISMLVVSYFSDKKKIRGPFMIMGSFLAVLGYAMLIAMKTPAAQYAGSVVVATGIYPAISTLLAWSGGNFSGEMKRAVVISMVVGFGNVGGKVVAGSFIYRQQDSPRYLPGHATCIIAISLLTVLCPFAMLRLHKLNKGKIAQCEREGITADEVDLFAELGDRSPLYRYTL